MFQSQSQLTVLLQGHKADTFVDCWDIDFEMADIVLVVRMAVVPVPQMEELDIELDKDLK